MEKGRTIQVTGNLAAAVSPAGSAPSAAAVCEGDGTRVGLQGMAVILRLAVLTLVPE